MTTLTKKMAEDLTAYLDENGVRVRYMHHDIDTIERMKIIRDLRLGEFDVLIGINLLREGLDIPEVSLVAILDADKEGFLRSETSLIQTIGRAARNAEGQVIMYADSVTPSMEAAITETDRRRKIQTAYNEAHGITPRTIRKDVREVLEISGRNKKDGRSRVARDASGKRLTRAEREELIRQLTKELKNDLCRGTAAVCGEPVLLCPAVLGADGEAGRRPYRGAVACHQHRPENDVAQPALHGRHGDGDL